MQYLTSASYLAFASSLDDEIAVDGVFPQWQPDPAVGVITRSTAPAVPYFFPTCPMVASLIGPISNCVL